MKEGAGPNGQTALKSNNSNFSWFLAEAGSRWILPLFFASISIPLLQDRDIEDDGSGKITFAGVEPNSITHP